MKIYTRDYTQLTEEEKLEWEAVREREKIFSHGKESRIRKNLYREYPKAARHYLSLFPNNLLDIQELHEKDRLEKLCNNFLSVLDNKDTTELDILGFIKSNQAYFISGSILKLYNFGHHDAFIMPEFLLGVSFKVDYLLIGRGSGGYQFVFVEFENPYGNITTGKGELGATFRKGLKQVTDWEEWLEANYSSLHEVYSRCKSPNETLPDEFHKLDKTRLHFAVVAGRRTDFTDRTNRLRREYKEQQNITLLHYDNLYDNAKNVIGQPTY